MGADGPARWRIGDSLRWFRERRGWNQTELAEAAGISLKTVSRIENHGNFERTTLEALAGALGESLEALERFRPGVPTPVRVEAEREDADTYAGYKPHDIPVIAEGEASPQGELFWDNSNPLIEADEWMSRPPEVKDPRAYAVRVRGDSMVPAFYPGMRLIVSPNIPVRTGARVYVELHSGERLVKVARRQKGGWVLESLNPAYEARFVTDDEVGTMHKIAYAREL